MTDAPLYVIVGSFAAWEVYAAFFDKSRRRHTLSNRVHVLEKRHPKSRIAVFAVMLDVTAHLTFGTPLTVVAL